MACDSTVEQIVPSGTLIGIKFDLLTGKDIEKYCSDIDIKDRNGLTSSKLGLPHTSSQCTTCGSRNLKDCEGHFGHIKLPATIYHPYLISEIVQILNHICPECKSIKQRSSTKDSFVAESFECFLGENDYFSDLCKTLGIEKKCLLKILKAKFCRKKKCLKEEATTKKKEGCNYCSRSATKLQPVTKYKVVPENINGKKGFSIVVETMSRKIQNESPSGILPKDYWSSLTKLPHQQGLHITTTKLSPSEVFDILKLVDKEVIKQFTSRKDLLFLSVIPVTPNCHRLTEASHGYADYLSSYDERTKAYKTVVDASRKLEEFQNNQRFGVLASAYTTSRVLDLFNTSKLHSKKSSARDTLCKSGLHWLKDVVLSKRSDNAFRMVMVGDPKIGLSEIGVPCDIAKLLFISENINIYNREKFNLSCNKNKHHAWRNGIISSVHKLDILQVGDTYNRPLEDGDLVLINRPPSVHQHSLIALTIKILPMQHVISINPLCCAPLLGDFDGDCIHGYIPQSIHCRAELGELVSLKQQLFNVQDGRSLLSLTHDSLTAAHLLTSTEIYLNKFEMQQMKMLCYSELPYPAICKGPTLKYPVWTGHQLFSMLLPKELQMSKDEILPSSGASHWLQNSTGGIFSRMFRRVGKKTLDFLFSAQNVLCEYITMRGLTVSLDDLYLSSDLYFREKLIAEASSGLQDAEDACHIKQLVIDPGVAVLATGMDESNDSAEGNNFISRGAKINQDCIDAYKNVFNDLQNAICQYISKDNSMLTMIHAGSKGSLSKLVQQGVCLGLQSSATTLQFSMPHKLSCAFWNEQKAGSSCAVPANAVECATLQDTCSIITSSFLDGLNPLESFVHALSGRSNLFSQNAELPGTLTRKLMFFMRDLSLAYDGTVRSSHEQQLVQFSYNLLENTSPKDDNPLNTVYDDAAICGFGGQPVGSWAACSISETAYAALDQPASSLVVSPLISLKKVLESGGCKTRANPTITIYLSKRLQKWNYGFEYGALAVKHHLERTLFTDVVETVMIVYGGHEVQRTNLSPWILHFHVSKDKMIMKKLNVEHIMRKLRETCVDMRAKQEILLPKPWIMCKDCSLLASERENGNLCCITVSFETSVSCITLETVRDIVASLFLQTLIKGFMEFNKVDILCDHKLDCQKGVFLKVSSEGKFSGKVWNTLQNACIPIIDLIDWEHSHPDNMSDIFSVFGINSAWRYFVGSLKSASADIGRTVNREHLLIVADSLSSSGCFLGLTSKGLEQQRIHASCPSPFSRACFSNPSNHFINAAKLGSTDNLHGAVDALAWGKEVPVGSGGPFEIIYRGKVHEAKRDNVYKTMDSLYSLCLDQNHSKSKVFSRSGISVSVVEHTREILKKILHMYRMDENLSKEDESYVMEALSYHPYGEAKKGTGVKKIKIGHKSNHPDSRCFILIREDGTEEDFSYRKCITGMQHRYDHNMDRK